jgi:hypothetical protein
VVPVQKIERNQGFKLRTRILAITKLHDLVLGGKSKKESSPPPPQGRDWGWGTYCLWLPVQKIERKQGFKIGTRILGIK